MKGCRPLEEFEQRAVKDSFRGRYAARDRALFVLGYRTGLRISELLAIRIPDIANGHKVADTVEVRKAQRKGKLEGAIIPLHEESKKAVQAWLDELVAKGLYSPNGFLFRSQKDPEKPMSAAQGHRILKAAYRRADLQGKVSTHSMRKTFANRIYEQGVAMQRAGRIVDPLRLTAKALHHKDVNTTDSYLQFRSELLREAVLAG